ncbi:MAG: hypothetical protein ACRD03_05465 [Acidimicrobiales bacterium]
MASDTFSTSGRRWQDALPDSNSRTEFALQRRNATLEALLVHARCLINFLCGNYKGEWLPSDMRPADFVRTAWVLPDDEMDRRLRGRLPVINESLAHLSWKRVTNTQGVIWPTGLVAHEVHWSMHKFVDAVRAMNTSSAALWSVAAAEADRWMPPRRTNWAELRGFEPAPPRKTTPADPVVLDDVTPPPADA